MEKENVLIRQPTLSFSNFKKSSFQNKSFTFIDLFAGIGGMRLAFETHGGICLFSCEKDINCQKTYFENFGDTPFGDIRLIDTANIPEHDILLAGFPCQPFSIAGVSKKNSMGRVTGFSDQTHGTLFFEIVRILDAKRPKAFLLENVKNLKSHDGGHTWQIITETLNELDYQIFYAVLDGKFFVPQHRERIFIVGFDKHRYRTFIDFDFDFETPVKSPNLKEILETDVDEKYTLSAKLWNYLQGYALKHKQKGNGFGFGLADLDGITRTLSARYYKDGSEILIRQQNKNPRRLTPRECARLQGFPDTYKIVVSDTQAYKQYGNSVVVPLVQAIAKNILFTLHNLDRER